MRVSEYGVLRDDGTQVPLYSLAADRPVALVFLRHLGCVFCRQLVAKFRDELADENVVFVTMSEPALTRRFRKWMRSPHFFLADPERRLYEAFGVPRTSAGRFFSAQVVRKALAAYREGHRNSLTFDDQLQLSGTYVMDREGRVLARFVAENISDAPSPETLREALCGAANEEEPEGSSSFAAAYPTIF